MKNKQKDILHLGNYVTCPKQLEEVADSEILTSSPDSERSELKMKKKQNKKKNTR